MEKGTTNQTLADVIAQLRAAWPAEPTAIQVARAARLLRGGQDLPAATPLKLAVASSFTFDLLVDPLSVRAACDGYAAHVYNGPYGQYVQELIDPNSGLHRETADMVLVAVRLQDALPDLYVRFNSLSSGEIDQLLDAWKREFENLLTTFRQLSAVPVLCLNYEVPAYPSLGLADRSRPRSQVGAIRELNSWLEQLATKIGKAFVVDIDSLAACCGRDRWTDYRYVHLARSPIAPAFFWRFAGEILRGVRAISGRARKVLALDCDNTLWGGVLGDVGSDGLQLGGDYPGAAYSACQRRILELYHRGVVLVVASKNDHAAVMDVFVNHPEMVLRPEHISYFGVNWNAKPENIRAAAAALNLGLDSFVFLDDHPIECEMMRQLVPEVFTVQLPGDPAEFEHTVLRLDQFDQLMVTDEDRNRGELYRQDAQRVELKANTTDLESFYYSLQMRASIGCNDEGQAVRAAQLAQRTNQFNMTTIRYTESQILELMRAGDAQVLLLRLADRFGDCGIVGMAITRHADDDCLVESFLMSCRVLGRTVEQAFLAWIARQARGRGAKRLVAYYAPTKKNRSFGNFFELNGLRLDSTGPDQRQQWTCDLQSEPFALTLPPWIEINSGAVLQESS